MKIYALIGIVILAASILAVAAVVSVRTEATNERVRVAFFPTITHTVPIVGTERGEFVKELGDVTVRAVVVDSGPQAIEALFANSVDLAYVGPSPFINGFVKSGGDKMKIISGAGVNGASFVVQQDSQIKSPSDLAGKRIAAPSIGNTQDVSLRTYLAEHGLEPAERGGNVVIYNTANPEIYTLFAKGDIDAAWVPEPTASILVMDLGGERLFQEEELWEDGRFSSVLLVGRTDFVERHPDWIDKWLTAQERTIEWINENPEQTEATFIDFYIKHTGRAMPKEIIHESFTNMEITSDPALDSVYIFAERAYNLGYLGRSGFSLDGMLYNSTELVMK